MNNNCVFISREARIKEKSKEKLKKAIREYVTEMFERSLDFCQVACPNENYKSLRSKILREGNNCIRGLHRVIDDSYDVVFVPSCEEIIEVRQNI